MALSENADSPASPPFSGNRENNLQPFFVIHRGHSRQKIRRKVDLSDTCAISGAALRFETQTAEATYCKDLNVLRIDAFNSVWSKIESSIKDVCRDINISIFNRVSSWVHESFKAIRSLGEYGFTHATKSYPVITDASFKQLFCGLVYTKNIEFVDDQLTFEELGVHLKSHGCHVATLTSLDFSAKNGVGGCLTQLLRQLLMVTLDAADLSTLAAWYCEKEYKPVVVIIEDMERCCGSVLSDFILMLSEWVVKIPVILIMGVATTLDAPRNILSSSALQRLCTSKFIQGSPGQRMDAIVEAVLLRPRSWFSVGHKVALFMRDYFLKHDGTLTSFIRALKIACMQHFCTEPLSFLLKDLDAEDDLQHIWSENQPFKRDMLLKHSSQFSSCKRFGKPTSEILVHALAELKRLHLCWGMVVTCLQETGKAQNMQLLDLYSEMLEPDSHKPMTSHKQGVSSLSDRCFLGRGVGSPKRVSISQALRTVRDLSPAPLSELLRSLEALAEGIDEIHKEVKELLSVIKSADGKSSRYDSTDISLRHASRSISPFKDLKSLNEKVAMLIERVLRDHMKPIEDLPFHEIFCFSKERRLQTALLGDPRKTIQANLLEFNKYMHCSCCSSRGNRLLPSLHDTSIMYILATEHGDVINVHDWYQSFKATVTHPSIKGRSKSKHSPSPKSRKSDYDSDSYGEAATQARFCRAVSELQITGLLRMPSKRRPDYVQRVAFGL